MYKKTKFLYDIQLDKIGMSFHRIISKTDQDLNFFYFTDPKRSYVAKGSFQWMISDIQNLMLPGKMHST